MKSTLSINNLHSALDLDSKTMGRVYGGIYRTGPQILAGQQTHWPATADGRVLGYDGQLHPGNAPLPGPTL